MLPPFADPFDGLGTWQICLQTVLGIVRQPSHAPARFYITVVNGDMHMGVPAPAMRIRQRFLPKTNGSKVREFSDLPILAWLKAQKVKMFYSECACLFHAVIMAGNVMTAVTTNSEVMEHGGHS